MNDSKHDFELINARIDAMFEISAPFFEYIDAQHEKGIDPTPAENAIGEAINALIRSEIAKLDKITSALVFTAKVMKH